MSQILQLKFVTDIKDQDYEVVEFCGDLDSSSIAYAEKQFNDLVRNFERKWLIADLQNLKYINSEGIGFLITLHAKLARKQKQLFICGVKPNVQEVFELIGLPKLVKIFPNMGETIKFMKKN